MARLLLFAGAREAAACKEADVPGASVGEVLDAAVERFGQDFGTVLAFCSVLVDDTAVARADAWRTPVGKTTEIAVLPPVSGGQHGHHAAQDRRVTVAVLTVSDATTAGQRVDESGPAVERSVGEAGFTVVATATVPDDRDRIEDALRSWSDAAGGGTDLVLTTGGTGLGPRDVTPEATRAVIDREVPGIPEAMRAAGMRTTPYAALARQVAGQRGATLIVNLPGSPKAAVESLEAVMEVLPHAVALTRQGVP